MFSDRGHRGCGPQGNDGGPPDPTTGNASVLNNRCPQQPCSHDYLFTTPLSSTTTDFNNQCPQQPMS